MRRLICMLLLVTPLCAFAAHKEKKTGAIPAGPVISATLPVTTRSPEAKKLFDAAMVDYENLKTPEAVEAWRRAIKKDPEFAQAYLMIARAAFDPAEQQAARDKAKAFATKATPDEQLFIRWLAGAQDNDLVSAIAAMNDLLKKYPKDKRLLFQASVWFFAQGAIERSADMSERALAIDPNFCPALNEAGYAYAQTGQMEKAMAAMEKYISLLPNEPNPQDSYAELLRMGGRFNEALEHYRAALKLDPKFDSSQLGIGDTYSLMGEYEKARAAYLLAANMAPDNAVRLQYLGQLAQTHAREGNLDAADRGFEELIAQAQSAGLSVLQSTLLLNMALYQKDDAKAAALLNQAEMALAGPSVSPLERESQMAFILRDRVMRAAQSGDNAARQAALAQLKTMADSGRHEVVQQAFHLAMGASLIADKKNGEAVEHLYENSSNPRALQLLATAFQNMKATSEAESMRKKLASVREPTMEQAVATASLKN